MYALALVPLFVFVDVIKQITPSIIQNTASAWSNYTSDVRKTHCTKHPPGPGGACRAFAFITGAAATPRRFSRQRNSWILGSAAAVSLALRGDQSRSAIAPIFGHTVSSTAKAHGVAQVCQDCARRQQQRRLPTEPSELALAIRGVHSLPPHLACASRTPRSVIWKGGAGITATTAQEVDARAHREQVACSEEAALFGLVLELVLWWTL